MVIAADRNTQMLKLNSKGLMDDQIGPKNKYIEISHKSAARFTNFIPKAMKLKAVEERCKKMEEYIEDSFTTLVNPPHFITFL